MPGTQISTNTNFLKVVGGNLVKEVDKGTVGARERSWEAAGKKGVKHELVYSAWEGIIENIEIKEMSFGKVCNIRFSDATISIDVDGRYFQDFACKVFNADLKQPVVFHPYDIEDGENRKTGVSFQQHRQKLSNYFYDFDKKEKLHGFPTPDEAQKGKKGYWKFYFATVSEFLIEKIQELKFDAPKAQEDKPASPTEDFEKWANTPLPESDLPL